MDSYIVRIYRRSGRKGRILVGTVEAVGVEKKMAFSNIEELWKILCDRPRPDNPGKPKAQIPDEQFVP